VGSLEPAGKCPRQGAPFCGRVAIATDGGFLAGSDLGFGGTSVSVSVSVSVLVSVTVTVF
jgi:hypothetical protein